MSGRVIILPGRHQPPHNDHLEIIRRALAINGRLLIGLIVSRLGEELAADSELEREARRQNEPERTPFTFTERCEMLEAALTREERARARIIALPRPEAHWSSILAIIPEPRTWIVPQTGEAFDELKASFFRERGDEVMRIALSPSTDGRLVRDLLRNHELNALEAHVPRAVFDWLKQNARQLARRIT